MPDTSYIKTFLSRPPILYPLAALFHIAVSLSAIISLYPTPLSQRDWMRPLSMVVFSVLSVWLCRMKRSAAITYIALSVACLLCYYYAERDSMLQIFGQGFFPFNLFLSLFILIQFRKFGTPKR